MYIDVKCHYIPGRAGWNKKKKCAKMQVTTHLRDQEHPDLCLIGRVANCCIFFVVRRINGDILCDAILPHVALSAVKEHLIYLLLVILNQRLLLSNEPGLNLLKLFFVSLGCCSELIQLLLQLVSLLFTILTLGLRSLLFLFHSTSLDLLHLHPFLQLS